MINLTNALYIMFQAVCLRVVNVIAYSNMLATNLWTEERRTLFHQLNFGLTEISQINITER